MYLLLINLISKMKVKLEILMKNCIILIIALYLISCKESLNKNADALWSDGQKHRSENKLKESIISYKTLIERYPSDTFAAKAQFQIADIYLNDVKDFDYAVEEFQKVIDKYPENEFSKKSLFMIAYVYNNYLNAYSDAIDTYNLFLKIYPNDDLIPSVKFELDGLQEIQSTIDSLNDISNKKTNI